MCDKEENFPSDPTTQKHDGKARDKRNIQFHIGRVSAYGGDSCTERVSDDCSNTPQSIGVA